MKNLYVKPEIVIMSFGNVDDTNVVYLSTGNVQNSSTYGNVKTWNGGQLK